MNSLVTVTNLVGNHQGDRILGGPCYTPEKRVKEKDLYNVQTLYDMVDQNLVTCSRFNPPVRG